MRTRHVIHLLRVGERRTECGLQRGPIPHGTPLASSWRFCARCERKKRPYALVWFWLDDRRRIISQGDAPFATTGTTNPPIDFFRRPVDRSQT